MRVIGIKRSLEAEILLACIFSVFCLSKMGAVIKKRAFKII